MSNFGGADFQVWPQHEIDEALADLEARRDRGEVTAVQYNEQRRLIMNHSGEGLGAMAGCVGFAVGVPVLIGLAAIAFIAWFLLSVIGNM